MHDKERFERKKIKNLKEGRKYYQSAFKKVANFLLERYNEKYQNYELYFAGKLALENYSSLYHSDTKCFMDVLDRVFVCKSNSTKGIASCSLRDVIGLVIEKYKDEDFFEEITSCLCGTFLKIRYCEEQHNLMEEELNGVEYPPITDYCEFLQEFHRLLTDGKKDDFVFQGKSY